MNIDELSEILKTEQSLSDFISSINVSTDTEKSIVAALFAINYKVDKIDNIVSHLLVGENPLDRLSADLNGVTQQLVDNNRHLNEAVKKILKMNTKE